MANIDESEFDVEQARQCVLEEIVGCYNCQSWEEGPVWLGPKSDLEDLFINCDIEEEHWNEVLEDLHCPNCGTDLTELADEVEIKSDYDKKVEEVLEKAKSIEIVKRLKAFNFYLKQYPYLGLSDPGGTGLEILRTVGGLGKYELEPQEWKLESANLQDLRVFRQNKKGAKKNPGPLRN